VRITKTPLIVLMAAAEVLAQAPVTSWLDQPLQSWNIAASAIAKASNPADAIQKDAERCALAVPRDTAGERALAAGGWIPFHLFDRQMSERDVEIVGGLAASDGMCRPMRFNVFVFVGGKFAGTLSPVPMDSRADAVVAGGIRVAADDSVSAEFARYTDKDALCCPSARVRVRYQIDRTGASPVVVPVTAQPLR
jgi:hypothetical protein